MNFVIIYSNHHTDNFNHHLVNSLMEGISAAGHSVILRDLYKINFNPVLQTSDFERISSGNPPADIHREQEIIRKADVLVFIYPVWWGGMPAIVKGYIDRVFSWGFAYQSGINGVIPLLTGKKAVVMNTLGQTRAEYERGMFKAMNHINAEGVFGFCGIEMVEPLYFASIHSAGDQEKQEYIRQAISLLNALPVKEKAHF